jgi:dTDP-4-amino-4,6-dideoxygalactose transaminase
VAVELALRGLKVAAGDEVILAAYDFPGNFRAIEAIGARPVLVDLAPGGWSIDVEQVAPAISGRTKAVIASHLHGSLADMPRLVEIATAKGVGLVEDACQAPGAVVAGRPAGSWGDCGVFSFGGSKLLTAGRGGAVVTNRAEVLQRVKVFCERGNDAFPLSELQAAVLLPQIQELEQTNRMRRMAVEQLIAHTREIETLLPLRLADTADYRPAFYKLSWMIRQGAFAAADAEVKRQQFISAVQAEGVAMDSGFRGFARRSNQRCGVVGDLIHARQAAASTMILHHPVLLESHETIERVGRALRKVAKHLNEFAPHAASGTAVTSPGAESTR